MTPTREQASPTVFISYARANYSRIETIARRLRGWGYQTWMDQFDLDAGEDWRAAIRAAIADADFFVLAVSKSSLKSDAVEWELDQAQGAGTRVIPIVLGSFKSDSRVADRLNQLHQISFARGNERGMAALVEALGGIRSAMPTLPDELEFPAVGQNARMIAEIVRFLQQFSHSGGAVIFKGGESWQYYVQLLVTASEAEIYGEAVGNANLETDDELDDASIEALQSLGWQPATKDSAGNFTRTWFVNSGRARALLAGDIMRTFLDIYGHLKGERLSVEMQVED